MTCACEHLLAEHTASAPVTPCSDELENPGFPRIGSAGHFILAAMLYPCDLEATLANLNKSSRGNTGPSPASRGPAVHRCKAGKHVCHLSGLYELKHLQWPLAASTACLQWVPLGLELVCSILPALLDMESIANL